MSSYFYDVLLRHELMIPENIGNFDEDVESFAITCTRDPNRAVRKLEQSLRLEEHKLDEFMHGMKQFIENDTTLAIAMLPIRIVMEDGMDTVPQTSGSAYFGQEDTFLKLMLRLPSVQPSLMIILIEKIMELAANDDISQGRSLDSGHPALRLLNHIRWCDIIYDPKAIVESFMVY